MDIDVIIKKTLVFAGVFGVLMAAVVLVTTLTQSYLGQIFNIGPRVSMALSVLIAILLYDPTRRFLVNITDKYLFQKKKDFKEILNRLSGNIITILDLTKVGERILGTLGDSLHLESGAIVLKDEDEKHYRILNAFNTAEAEPVISKEDPLIVFLRQHDAILNLENPATHHDLPADMLERLRQFKAVLCIPLFIHRELIGVMTLGKKKSDEEYTADELDYLPTLAGQVAIALSNARLYEILKKSQIDFAQQAKMAAIGTLSAGISHEIKNPLNHMRLALGMLRMNRKLGVYKSFTYDQFENEVFNTLESIDGNITRATEVIERLSSFAKKPKDLKIEPISLEKAVENALKFVSREYEHYQIAVVRDFAPGLPDVCADQHAMEDIFLNLLVNARHAMKEKGTVTVTTARFRDEVEISIQDTGQGIAPENLEKIWDPFFTTKDTSRNSDTEAVKGTGLGLFIVRELIKKFGGRITVDSEVGKGTAFRISFPAAQQQAQAIGA